jgi:hypothetical protein
MGPSDAHFRRGRGQPSPLRSQSCIHRILTGAVICTLLSVASCAEIDTPLLSVEFGNDYSGSSVVDSLDAGPYDLRIQCEGAEQLTFSLKSGTLVLHASEVPCSMDAEYSFTLSESVDSEVSMELVGAGATGKGELYAA